MNIYNKKVINMLKINNLIKINQENINSKKNIMCIFLKKYITNKIYYVYMKNKNRFKIGKIYQKGIKYV